MRILYIIPDETVKSGGNWVTVKRLSEGLRKRQIKVDIIEVKDVTREKLMKYNVIHAFHVFKSLTKINHLIQNKPVVVSFTGTDLKQLQEMEENKSKIIGLLNKTKAIVVFHKEARDELIKEGIDKEKVEAIPQGPSPIIKEYSADEQVIKEFEDSNCLTFLFAGGMRKVKAPLEIIEMMSELVEKLENIRLIMIGPILEKDLGEKIKEKSQENEWLKYLGEASHDQAQDYISRSDIIINGSISEGMPNTLLEAQQMGKPILARDIIGNRAIVTHKENGFLFKDSEEFKYYATRLVKEPKLRRDMGLSALKNIKKYDVEKEISIYEEIYKS